MGRDGKSNGEATGWRMLFDVAKDINSSLDLSTVLDDILHRGLAAVGAKLGWMSLVRSDDQSRWLEMVAARGFEVSNAPGRGRFEIDSGLTGLVARTGEAYYSPDVSAERDYVEVLPAIRSELVIPITFGDELLGVFNVESVDIDGFGSWERELLDALASAAAVAIVNARTHLEVSDSLRRSVATLERKAKDTEALAAVSSAVNSSLDLEQVLHLIIETAIQVGRAPHCHLLLVDEVTGELILHTKKGLVDGSSEGSVKSLDEGITGWVAMNKRPLLVADVLEDARYVDWTGDTRSEVAVPLLSHGELMGVLNLESSAVGWFKAEDVGLLKILAHHAVVAIKNAVFVRDLQEAQSRALVAERLSAVGEVAGDMIHWVGNRAGLIPGAVESIRVEMGEVTDSVEEDLAMIDRNSREILKLKKRLLGAAQDESVMGVELAGALDEAIAAAGGDTPVDVIMGDGAKAAQASPAALGRILVVLIENAVEVTGEGGRVVVSCTLDGETGRICIDVADSGPGVPDGLRRRVFNPFFTTKSDHGGTGMGLWLAYRAAARMGGHLSLFESSSKGAVFRLDLPVSS